MNLTMPLCGVDWKANPGPGWGGTVNPGLGWGGAVAAGRAKSADVRVDWASGTNHPGTST